MAFPSNPTNGQTATRFGRRYQYNSTTGQWRGVQSVASNTIVDLVDSDYIAARAASVIDLVDSDYIAARVTASGTGVTTYSTLAELPLADNTAGAQAFVAENNRLYIWNGSGWYNIALINTAPSITSGGDASYDFAIDGTPIVITLVAADPEGLPITWSYAVTSGTLGSTATISQSDNVFTVTPSTDENDAGEFSITFTASDGVNLATAVSSFTLSFIGDWSTTTLLHTLNNPNPYGTTQTDYFGMKIGISGNYVIVGTQYEDDAGGNQSGKAYIYNVTTGALVYTLNNPNAYGTSQDDAFGGSVAISGNYAIVGAPGEDEAGGNNSGKVYIYNVSTGALVRTLNNPNAYDTIAFDNFGYTVAISGNYAFVTAIGEDDPGADGGSAGKVYIFDVDTGTLVKTLNNPNAYADGLNSDNFGTELATYGNYLIVGTPQENDATGNDSGKVYIFKTTTGDWSDTVLLHTLDNPNPYGTSAGDVFGASVAIWDNYAIIGAYNEGASSGTYSGKAYIFNVETGTLFRTLNNPNPFGTSQEDRFGISVAIAGDYALVGASFEEAPDGGLNAGRVYIYNIITGTLLQTLNDPNPFYTTVDDKFATRIAMTGNYAIVSAVGERDNTNESWSGKCYIFQAG